MVDDSKVAVLLEDIKAQFRVFGEGLDILRREMKQDINELKTKMKYS
jgi:hypothetical protein